MWPLWFQFLKLSPYVFLSVSIELSLSRTCFGEFVSRPHTWFLCILWIWLRHALLSQHLPFPTLKFYLDWSLLLCLKPSSCKLLKIDPSHVSLTHSGIKLITWDIWVVVEKEIEMHLLLRGKINKSLWKKISL